MRDLDAGNGGKGRRQNLGFIVMGGQRFRNDLDFHALERLGRIDEPLHFLFLIGARKRRKIADFLVEKLLRLVHSGQSRTRHCQHDECRSRH